MSIDPKEIEALGDQQHQAGANAYNLMAQALAGKLSPEQWVELYGAIEQSRYSLSPGTDRCGVAETEEDRNKQRFQTLALQTIQQTFQKNQIALMRLKSELADLDKEIGRLNIDIAKLEQERTEQQTIVDNAETFFDATDNIENLKNSTMTYVDAAGQSHAVFKQKLPDGSEQLVGEDGQALTDDQIARLQESAQEKPDQELKAHEELANEEQKQQDAFVSCGGDPTAHMTAAQKLAFMQGKYKDAKEHLVEINNDLADKKEQLATATENRQELETQIATLETEQNELQARLDKAKAVEEQYTGKDLSADEIVAELNEAYGEKWTSFFDGYESEVAQQSLVDNPLDAALQLDEYGACSTSGANAYDFKTGFETTPSVTGTFSTAAAANNTDYDKGALVVKPPAYTAQQALVS